MKEHSVHLIVNADDLGMSAGVNAGIVEAHRRGIVSSASLMVLRPAAPDAARVAAELPSLSIGLHLEIEDDGDEATVERECRAQLAAFQRLLGRKPTHLDSHHHVHLREPVRSVARGIATELGVPLRAERIRYEGGFYGRSSGGEARPGLVSVEHLIELIAGLPRGWTELGCHPGLGVRRESSYGPEREREVRTLCDPRVRAAIEGRGVALHSFADVR